MGAASTLSTIATIPDVFCDLPTLVTPRLCLRKLTIADVDDVFAYASDPIVSRYTLWQTHRSRADSERFIEAELAKYESLQPGTWGIVHRQQNRVVGTCGFGTWHMPHARIEVGYALGRAYWGQGLMPEALRAVISFCFSTLPLNRIEAFCLAENHASARVLEKVGMRYEGLLHEALCHQGRYCDLKLYAILQADCQRSRYLFPSESP
ncbi:GNAT family N-acetyltransferase [Trichothermofontia sp.]